MPTKSIYLQGDESLIIIKIGRWKKSGKVIIFAGFMVNLPIYGIFTLLELDGTVNGY